MTGSRVVFDPHGPRHPGQPGERAVYVRTGTGWQWHVVGQASIQEADGDLLAQLPDGRVERFRLGAWKYLGEIVSGPHGPQIAVEQIAR